jgi:hypothetical protein
MTNAKPTEAALEVVPMETGSAGPIKQEWMLADTIESIIELSAQEIEQASGGARYSKMEVDY